MQSDRVSLCYLIIEDDLGHEAVSRAWTKYATSRLYVARYASTGHGMVGDSIPDWMAKWLHVILRVA